MSDLDSIDWEQIHQLKFVEQPGCWNTCGSYCCKHESPHLAFNFLKPGTAGMIFFGREFDYLEKAGRLQAGFEPTVKRWSWKVDEELELRFVIARCALNGMCSIPQYRPLCCKLYPFLPRVDLQSHQVTGYVGGVLFDQFWDIIGVDHPCTLVREKPNEIQTQIGPGIQALLQHAYIVFYLKCTELFIDSVRIGIQKLRDENPGQKSQQLSLRWEKLYLQGKAFDVEKLRKDIRKSYDSMTERFGRFSTI